MAENETRPDFTSLDARLKGNCTKCLARPGTHNWVGQGDALSYIHGLYEKWCEICVLEAQIKHAKERAAELPAMEEKLKALLEKE